MILRSLFIFSITFLLFSLPNESQASRRQSRRRAVHSQMDSCSSLPSTIKVVKSSAACGKKPAVILSGSWKSSFSAAFRWDDGSKKGQDRSPFSLEDGSPGSSPYKAQKRIRGKSSDTLCYGKFLKRSGYPKPQQLTIKRTTASYVNRFCVSF